MSIDPVFIKLIATKFDSETCVGYSIKFSKKKKNVLFWCENYLKKKKKPNWMILIQGPSYHKKLNCYNPNNKGLIISFFKKKFNDPNYQTLFDCYFILEKFIPTQKYFEIVVKCKIFFGKIFSW